MSFRVSRGAVAPRRFTDDSPLPWRRTWIGAGLLLFSFLSMQLASAFPQVVETAFSKRFFPFVRGIQRGVADVFPGHLAETLVIFIALGILVRFVRAITALMQHKRSLRNLSKRALMQGVQAAGVLYFLFLFGWGFNHARRPYAEHAQLEQSPVVTQELEQLLQWLVEEANSLRAALHEESMTLQRGAGGFDDRLATAYKELARDVPALESGEPLFREALLSPVMSRLGITGIYSPFTAEIHLNKEVVPWLMPFVSAHEAAHFKGFAREDEANFIAWQVCRRSPYPALRYSATLVALQFTARALQRTAPDIAEALHFTLSEPVLVDLEADRYFWLSKRTALTEVGQTANHAYLKLQGHAEGGRSYGRMVDLLVAERRPRKPPVVVE